MKSTRFARFFLIFSIIKLLKSNYKVLNEKYKYGEIQNFRHSTLNSQLFHKVTIFFINTKASIVKKY